MCDSEELSYWDEPRAGEVDGLRVRGGDGAGQAGGGETLVVARRTGREERT